MDAKTVMDLLCQLYDTLDEYDFKNTAVKIVLAYRDAPPAKESQWTSEK